VQILGRNKFNYNDFYVDKYAAAYTVACLQKTY